MKRPIGIVGIVTSPSLSLGVTRAQDRHFEGTHLLVGSSDDNFLRRKIEALEQRFFES